MMRAQRTTRERKRVPGVYVTTDLETALAYGYIGEVPIDPLPIASAVHQACTGWTLPSWHIFYCGTPDERLREMFGYDSKP